MELFLENIGEDEQPLVGSMGVDYTVGQIKKMILEICAHLAETPMGDDTEVACTVLMQLLAFVAMQSLPEGMEPMSDCDRWSALRVLEQLRKAEATEAEEKQQIYLIQFLLKGYTCAGCTQSK